MHRRHWFSFVSNGIVALFFGIMIYALTIAFTRKPGSTGLDMGSIQKMRYDADALRNRQIFDSVDP